MQLAALRSLIQRLNVFQPMLKAMAAQIDFVLRNCENVKASSGSGGGLTPNVSAVLSLHSFKYIANHPLCRIVSQEVASLSSPRYGCTIRHDFASKKTATAVFTGG